MPNTKYPVVSTGKNDECYTPREGVEAILPYILQFAFWKRGLTSPAELTIWCPFDTEESEFYKVFTGAGFNVEISDIKTGQDFFAYEPPKWDVMISNPPFTNKRAIFERALSFNKPFALLMTAAWLNDAAPCDLFRDKGLQLFLFEKRLRFKNQEQKSKINFKSIYYCRDFLPSDIVVADILNILLLSAKCLKVIDTQF